MLDWFKDWFLGISRQVVEMPVYWAAPMMVFVGALDSSLLSLPEVNDYITIARVANHPSEVAYFPLFPALGSVLGCLVLYRISKRGEQFITKRFHPQQLDRAKQLYRKWGLLALVVPALLPPPVPFKVFVVTAGVLNYPVRRFALVIMITRTVRYYFWGILAYFFRSEVRRMIDWLGEHVLEVLGVILAIGALVLLVRWLLLRGKGPAAENEAQVTFTD